MSEQSTDPLAEVTAMQKIVEAVESLDQAAIGRILRWAADRYGVTSSTSKKGTKPDTHDSDESGNEDNAVFNLEQFSTLADLFAETGPKTDADKALVGGYWFQYHDKKQDFGAQEVNTALKHMGHGVGNITDAFDALKARKPAQVMQVKKAGTSKQARKRYKLTTAGKNAVELMVAESAEKK